MTRGVFFRCGRFHFARFEYIWAMALSTYILQIHCPGFTTSNIRQAALNKTGDVHGETPMDEGKMMSSEDCAQHILKAIRKKKRTLVLTFTGKRTVFLEKFFPKLADKLTYKFFFKDGKLVK